MPNKINRRQLLGTSLLATGLTPSVLAQEQGVITSRSLNYETDIVVCGGGPAGVAAATNAARLGCKVLLLERYGRLGGMGIHARVWPLLGRARSPFLKEVHQKIGGSSFDPEITDLHYADFVLNAGGKILLHSWVAEPVSEGNRLTGVKAVCKEGIINVKAKIVIDATGDADVAFNAGVPCETGRDGDGLVQPMSVMFCVEGVADDAKHCGSEEAARATRINDDETWESITTKAQENGELPATVGVVRTYKMGRKGKATVNASQINGLFGTKVEDLTKAELECRRQALQITEFMRRHLPGYEHCYISHMPSVIGVRETRRIKGLAQLTREDLVSGRKWDNAVVHDATFCLDIHNPAGGGQAENQTDTAVQGFAERDKPYDIPLTCLIPQNAENLLVAGRCISGTHVAHSSYRVMNICIAVGAGAGVAAGVAVQDGKALPDVDIKKVQKILGFE
ncbi:MAG: FAD-dependent oxidoreductase [Planctomycetaceae bacterium]|jgi:hypothetical protein|nr:FAD-dependent oxidoreductase [Planctomycetaceae bacterium]